MIIVVKNGHVIKDESGNDERFINVNKNINIKARKFCIEGEYLRGSVDATLVNSIEDGKDFAELQRTLKGMYCARMIDEANGKVYVTNDLLSKRPVYYYQNESLIVVANSFFVLCKAVNENGGFISVSQCAIETMCRHGFLEYSDCYEEHTRYLLPYESITIDLKTGILSNVYCSEYSAPKYSSINQITEELDKLFYNACKFQFGLNTEQHCDQICTLSGGMDSRIVFLYILRLQREQNSVNTYTYTYAQSNSADDRIAKEIAKYFGVEHVFLSLNKCDFIFDRDTTIGINEGQMYYAGTTGAREITCMCAEQNKAYVIHTGLGGGELMGDILYPDGDSTPGKLYKKANLEVVLNMVRKCLNFQRTTINNCLAISPFLDEDFFEYVNHMPAEYRLNRRIYVEWYKRVDNATKFETTYYKGRIGKKKNPFVQRVIEKGKSVLHIKTRFDMNPFEYWYSSNKKLREFLNTIYDVDMKKLSAIPFDKTTIEESWGKNCVSKLRVLTATYSIISMYQKDEEDIK